MESVPENEEQSSLTQPISIIKIENDKNVKKEKQRDKRKGKAEGKAEGKAKGIAISSSLQSTRSKQDAKTVGLGHGAKKVTYKDDPVQLSKANQRNNKGQDATTRSNNNTLHQNQDASFLTSTFRDKEDKIRLQAESTTRHFRNVLKANVASILIFILYLIKLESILSCLLTVGLTLYWYFQAQTMADWSGGSIDWVVLGFAVVTPISLSIGMAFRRRERALIAIARLRASLFQLYLAHCLWTNWDDVPDDFNYLEHCDLVLTNLVGIGDELSRFLSMPTSTRSFHRMMKSGRKEAAEIVEIQYRLFDSLYTKRITKLTTMTEILKVVGLSATEASRIRNFERDIGEAIETLRIVKMYRTPQALRSFGRLFTIVLPPLYAASFAQLAFDLNTLTMGIIFSCITPLCLTALYESMSNLEDPFVGWITLDGIDCIEEFEVLHWHQLNSARSEIFPDAQPFPISEITSMTLGVAGLPGSMAREDSYSGRISHFALSGSPGLRGKDDNSGRISHFALDASSRSIR